MFAINIENLKKHLKCCIFYNVYSKCGHEYEKIFKEEESLWILKILGLLTNIEEY